MNVYVGPGCRSALYTRLYKVQVFSVRPWFLSPYPTGFKRLTFLLDLRLCTVAPGRLYTNSLQPTAATDSLTSFTVALILQHFALLRWTFFFFLPMNIYSAASGVMLRQQSMYSMETGGGGGSPLSAVIYGCSDDASLLYSTIFESSINKIKSNLILPINYLKQVAFVSALLQTG